MLVNTDIGLGTEKVIPCIAAFLYLLSVTFVTGRLVQYGRHRMESGYCEAMISGSIVIFIIQMLLQAATVFLKLEFSVMRWGGLGILTVMTFAGIGILRRKLFPGLWIPMLKDGSRTLKEAGYRERIIVFGLGMFLFLMNVVSIELYEPFFGVDMTVEETVTVLWTDRLYGYHPATGAELVYGMEAYGKFNVIPGFYAMLCALTGAEPSLFICRWIPVWGLLLNYAAVYLLITTVLDGKNRFRTPAGRRRLSLYGGYAMIFYGILVWMGDYSDAAPGFYLLHQGWNPRILFCMTGMPILLSLLISVIRRGMQKKERRISGHE